MNRNLIFIDIDGTLTEPGHNVPPESALEAIGTARENGHLVFLCTGRNYGMLSPLLKYGFDGFVGSCGGYIQCRDKVIYDRPMADEQKEKVLDVMQRNGIFCTVECRSDSYMDESLKLLFRNMADGNGNSELLRWREQIEKDLNIRSMEEYDGRPIYKVSFMCEHKKQLTEPREVLSDEFCFCMQEDGTFAEYNGGLLDGELVNRKFDKGRGIKRVCEYLNMDIKDTIAFGDSMNDIEMIESAGLSICMENGSRKLKQLADEVCPSVTEDGLYKAFKKHGLI